MEEVKIAASIIAASLRNLERLVDELEEAKVDLIHVDSMDGHFFDYIGLCPFVVKALKEVCTLEIRVHLAVRNPEKLLKQFIDAEADLISLQFETCTFPYRLLRRITSAGIKAGLAILPSTPIELLSELFDSVNEILLLSNNDSAFLDWSDSTFIPQTIDKIKKLREKISSGNVEIAVDGGITVNLIKPIVRSGATVIVMGRGIFQGDIKENVKKIRELILDAFKK